MSYTLSSGFIEVKKRKGYKEMTRISAIKLKANYLTEPNSLSPGEIILSWLPINAKKQTAFQIIGKMKDRIIFDSGKVETHQNEYKPDFAPEGGVRVNWSITLWNEKDEKGIGATSFFETTLSKVDWQARWIDPERKKVKTLEERNPASYLKKEFNILTVTTQYRLHATAHGIYNVWINGKLLKDWLLAPGPSQYNKRLMVQSYDITKLLKQGKNEILVSLGDGWYRGSTGNDLATQQFGDDLAFLCQIMSDNEVILVSDESWLASDEGPLGLNDMMRGEEYDATKESIQNWYPVTTSNYGFSNLIGSDCQPIVEKESFNGKLLKTPLGETVIDFEQNFSGYVQLKVIAKKNQKITLTYGETLDENGNFTVKNFQNPAKPECKQEVSYVCKEGENIYHPTKCYFGFRYLKVETDVDITGEEFTGIAVYSDMETNIVFNSGDKMINQLFNNSLWSMKSNFVGIPTDCPTREKSGFTGDAQIFSQTAFYLMDSYPVFRSWLQDVSAAAFDNGGLRQIAPDNRKAGYFENSSGWCDAIEIIPWRIWKHFNRLEVAEQNYETMKNWMMFSINRAKETRPQNLERVSKELLPYFADQGFHWGEWLEVGSNNVETTRNNMMNGEPEVATAFLSWGSKLISELALELGNKEDYLFFGEVSKKAKQAYREAFLKGKKIKTERQALYVRPLFMELFESEEREIAAKQLADLIENNHNKLNTGFLSTGEICRVLTDNGQNKKAYDLLLQSDYPGWLYPITKGATTIWERWDGINEKGEARDSLNHYAYGAITGWLIDRSAGINIENGKIIIQPFPDERIRNIDVKYNSPVGRVGSKWAYTSNKIEFEIEVPTGKVAQIILPDGRTELKDTGVWKYSVKIGRETL